MTWITTTLLLEQLSDGDQQAWDGFLDRYREPVQHFARRLGVPTADVDDLVQDTLVAFLDAWRRGRYQRDKGRLGSFLFSIAAQQIREHRRRRMRRTPALAETAFWRDVPEEASLRESWNVAWARSIFARCLECARRELEPRTLAAFEGTVLEQRPAAEVADELGMTANAVYIAKHRVLARVRELREGFERVD